MPAFVVWRGYVVRGAAIAWAAGLVVVTMRVQAAQRRAAALRRTDDSIPMPRCGRSSQSFAPILV